MITEKQKCIAEQAVYGDLKGIDTKNEISNISYINTNTKNNLVIVLPTKGFDYLTPIDMIKLVLRPMSDLTKEITHKGYNDDKPFIPIDGILSDESLRSLWKRSRRSIECVGDYIFCTVKDIDGNVGKEFEIHIGLRLFDFLNQLHFDYRNLISKGEAISTDEVGDVYGVKKDE